MPQLLRFTQKLTAAGVTGSTDPANFMGLMALQTYPGPAAAPLFSFFLNQMLVLTVFVSSMLDLPLSNLD
jgi:hypothetical protein